MSAYRKERRGSKPRVVGDVAHLLSPPTLHTVSICQVSRRNFTYQRPSSSVVEHTVVTLDGMGSSSAAHSTWYPVRMNAQATASIILHTLRVPSGLTVHDISIRTQLSESTVRAHLKKLQARGTVVSWRHGQGFQGSPSGSRALLYRAS